MSEVNGHIALPNGWKWVTISDLINEEGIFCDGDWIESKDQDANGDVRLIQLADIGDGYFRNKSDRYLTSSKAQELNCTFLKKDDILVARMPDPLGRSCIFPLNGELKYVTAVDVCIIRPNKRIVDTKFLTYIINAPQSRNAISNLETGTTRKRISRKNLATILYPLPPLKEQQQIVSKIEELFSELDKSIEQLKTTQQQLKLYRQSVLKWAFEGRLTNENVKDGQLPKEWEHKTLGNIAKFINGDRGKNYPNRSEYVEKGIAFINTGHIEPNGKLSLETMHYISRQKFNTLNSGKVAKGDILYCLRGATLGKTAIVDQFEEGAIASSLVIIRLEKQISNRFVYYYLKSPLGRGAIKEFDNGSAQPNLSAKSVSLYQIAIPSFVLAP